MPRAALEQWVKEVAEKTRPARIHWCDGSDAEYQALVAEMLREGTLHRLNQETHPGCYLHRSSPSDVARTEHLTFICTPRREDAGPNNNWMAPDEAREKLGKLFDGSMKGRTMYVVPYLMGPVGSPYGQVGVEITDSPYVAASMRLMTRMGKVALEQLERGEGFVRGLHSLGDLSPDRRFIVHFPEQQLIWSVGSGYGGNALLGKKCHSLRIASWLGKDQGWMAEHTLIIGVEDPSGQTTYMVAAFPSACGKTNLAMLVPPPALPGYKVWTVGDDIAWLYPSPDGGLRAINPESGFFGVAVGTSMKTNPNMMRAAGTNSIFTNVALTPSGEPWWEGKDPTPPDGLVDWQGKAWVQGQGGASHPNARITTPARQCPSISPRFDDPEGVPISAIIFGGRRSRLAPLVYQAYDWRHGVFVGAGMASETTAAASGAVGVTRRDPMAMIPFCGYHMGDYFGHWLRIGEQLSKPPAIFHVNWFRTGADGKLLWPGYGENLRVLRWILDRVHGGGKALETPIGYVPSTDALELSGLNLSQETMAELLKVDREAWMAELKEQEAFFEQFGDRLPREIREEHKKVGERLNRSAVPVA